ncbi:hypothetical protein HHI36_021018 [Cryptolaemus montrouzieri]|uniref:Serine palmitoyltransferase 1 n=1 Tax=Cryptolaemus montrouzieri TaxID=559131 RepID=A0ABD2MVN1_9CUCU
MLDEKLLQERLNQFKPEPLVDFKHDPNNIYEIPAVVESEDVVDLAKTNFLDVLNDEGIKRTAEETIRKYGVGTCGPRAFYGTTDVHLTLEEKLASFLRAEECIIYSYGFVAISSSIAAYTNKRDVVFIDKEANFPIQQGLQASKSRVVRFDHNDPESLFREAEKVKAEENKKKPSRKFLIIEGISWKTGKLCPLPRFIEVAEMFKMRIFLEESYTLGILGESGKGLTEHFDIPIEKIDMSFGTIEGALGSIGGYCAGSHAVIEHQRLSGSGYIFSASLPTYLAQIVIKSLDILQDKPRRFARIAREFHQFLEDCGFLVISDPVAPFKVFTVKNKENRSELEIEIHKFCANEGVHFIQGENGLVINLNVALLEEAEKLDKVHRVLEKAISSIVDH